MLIVCTTAALLSGCSILTPQSDPQSSDAELSQSGSWTSKTQPFITPSLPTQSGGTAPESPRQEDLEFMNRLAHPYVPWLDRLPHPDHIDWHDPYAVATAYAETALQWDTRVDMNMAYSTERASIYQPGTTRAGRKQLDIDTLGGQADFLEAMPHSGYITVVINDAFPEGMLDSPADFKVIVDYTATTNYEDGTEANSYDGYYWITLKQDADQIWWINTTRQDLQ